MTGGHSDDDMVLSLLHSNWRDACGVFTSHQMPWIFNETGGAGRSVCFVPWAEALGDVAQFGTAEQSSSGRNLPTTSSVTTEMSSGLLTGLDDKPARWDAAPPACDRPAPASSLCSATNPSRTPTGHKQGPPPPRLPSNWSPCRAAGLRRAWAPDPPRAPCSRPGRRPSLAPEAQVLPGGPPLPTARGPPAEEAGVFCLRVSQVLKTCPWQQQKGMFEKNKMK